MITICTACHSSLQGRSVPTWLRCIGDEPSTVEFGLRRLEQHGFTKLAGDERAGRPSRLTGPQLTEVGRVRRQSPSRARSQGVGPRDGRGLSGFLQTRLGVSHVRLCSHDATNTAMVTSWHHHDTWTCRSSSARRSLPPTPPTPRQSAQPRGCCCRQWRAPAWSRPRR